MHEATASLPARSGNSLPAIGHEQKVTADGELWTRVRAGDADAFGALFERHAKAIYNFCFRRTGEWAAAEDLTSIVFLEAWRRREKELPDDKVRAWLFGIATLVVRSQWRKRRRHQAALNRLPRCLYEPGFAEASDARMDAERRMQSVLASIDQLSLRERDVVALCLWSELSYEEAALALDIPIGTVRSRLARARARLVELEQANGRAVLETIVLERSCES
jgi:RNA polymerase sigma-70 factor (ECF subfamily)